MVPAQARRRIADEEEANKQGGFGLLETDTSGFFDVEQQAEALAFFQENGCANSSATRIASSSRCICRAASLIGCGAASAQTPACSAR